MLQQKGVVCGQWVGDGHMLDYCESWAAEIAQPSAESAIEARIAIDRDREGWTSSEESSAGTG